MGENTALNDTKVEEQRNLSSLKRYLGKDFMKAFENPNVVEIMLNSDGYLWVDELGVGMSIVGFLSHYHSKSALNVIATMLDEKITKTQPMLEGEFPMGSNVRFAGQTSPIVSAPTFSIRKPALLVFTLENYLEKKIITNKQMLYIKDAIENLKNIIIIGGTKTGKTTLVNACIHYMSEVAINERIVVIEDTREIQCTAINQVVYHTSINVSMSKLVKTVLRMNPDRIIIGEVRDETALDLLDAWSTGHPGGISTIHGNNAEHGLERLEGLVTRNKYAPKEIIPVIGNAIDVIINICVNKKLKKFEVKEIIELEKYDKKTEEFVFKYIT